MKSVGDVRIPVRSAPPHDPRWMTLDVRDWRWRPENLEEESRLVVGDRLGLARRHDETRSWSERTGSLGGRVLPPHVAVSDACRGEVVFLLARQKRCVLRFDPCSCAFVAVPCRIGAETPESRPHAIAIRGSKLFVSDPGIGRLRVYDLDSFIPLRDLRPRRAAGDPATDDSEPLQSWSPTAFAFDRCGELYVADQRAGVIHRFGSDLEWRGELRPARAVIQIAVDRADRIVIVTRDRERPVMVADREGRLVAPSALEPPLCFQAPAVSTDTIGRILLTSFCAENPDADALWFDRQGDRTSVATPRAEVRYESEGVFYSEALDSRILACRWHRVVVEGEIPAGCYVEIATYTSETDGISTRQIRELPADAWSLRPRMSGPLASTSIDTLIRSEPARYLWLRVVIRSRGSETPSIERIRLEFPRISLRRYLPSVFGSDEHAADFTDRFLSVFDETQRSIESHLDTQASLFDPRSAPNARGRDFLGWLETWLGIRGHATWTDAMRREYLVRSGHWIPRRGTQTSLHEQLLLYLGVRDAGGCVTAGRGRSKFGECTTKSTGGCTRWKPPALVLEHYRLRRWLYAGRGRLGDAARLWSERIVGRTRLDRSARVDRSRLIMSGDPVRDPFHVHAHRFSVFVPGRLEGDPERRRELESLVREETPAHASAAIVYVQPRMRLGVQSMIGYDAVIGRYPSGSVLGEEPLGSATVVGAGSIEGPRAALGRSGRIGSTARMIGAGSASERRA